MSTYKRQQIKTTVKYQNNEFSLIMKKQTKKIDAKNESTSTALYCNIGQRLTPARSVTLIDVCASNNNIRNVAHV